MQMNHHILAKATTDSVLSKFKTEEWTCHKGNGKDFFRVTTDATFPSPDAAFYDENSKFLVSFEFKPPTETKRGILTGVGQSIAYLQSCNVSYLIAPCSLEDFNLHDYLRDLFQNQIYGKLPSGLITYDNNKPENVELVMPIADSIEVEDVSNAQRREISNGRYWAKHQDLPIPLFHLLLHCYFLKKSHTIGNMDAFKYCWRKYIISPTILQDLQPKQIFDCNNQVITTLRTGKPLVFLEKTLKQNKSFDEIKQVVAKAIDTEFVGDNMFNSCKKNFVTFLKHLQVIDSEGDITEAGFKLYHLGLKHGASSKIFKEYFAKEILTTGHHLDLLLDLEKIAKNNPDNNFGENVSAMEKIYEASGLIKRNPNRKASEKSTVGFLKYEIILWKSLDFIIKRDSLHYDINWREITKICSLPDL